MSEQTKLVLVSLTPFMDLSEAVLYAITRPRAGQLLLALEDVPILLQVVVGKLFKTGQRTVFMAFMTNYETITEFKTMPSVLLQTFSLSS